jgi:glycosyltransferase involved in cell wall biosynthesis
LSEPLTDRGNNIEQASDEVAVSVIVPIYNAARFLDECLGSIEKQTLSHYEVIMVNDGSTDDSQSIAETYAKRDERFKLVNLNTNRGLPAARNAGVQEARGSYLVHLDSDDFWLDSRTLEVLFTAARLEGADVLRFNGRNYQNGELGTTVVPPFNAVNITLTSNRGLWIFRSVFLFFFCRRFIEDHQLRFDETCNIGEDGIFLSRALPLAQRISSVPNLFYAYRRHADSMMGNNWSAEQFLEDKRASEIISRNLLTAPSVRSSYLYLRYKNYWVNKLLPRIVMELSPAERITVFDSYRNSLVVDESTSEAKIRGGVRFTIYRFFLRGKHYSSLERFVRGFHKLTPLPYSHLGYYLYLIELGRQLISSFLRIAKLKLSQRIRVGATALFRRRTLKALRARQFVSREALKDYNFTLDPGRKTPGITALIRVKNEESNIADCIASVMPCVDEVLIIDNGSTDATVSIIQDMLKSQVLDKPLRLLSYPFLVSRCGREHAETDEHSVHSLAYYYNWCLSHCSTSHVIKWDADMRVINEKSAQLGFISFLKYIRTTSGTALGSFPVQTIYLDKSGTAVTTSDDIHTELRYFPNTPNVYFAKGNDWEYLRHPRFQNIEKAGEVFCYEIKDTRQEEFCHWSAISFDGWRKALEYRNYRLVAESLHIHESNFVPVQPHRLKIHRTE